MKEKDLQIKKAIIESLIIIGAIKDEQDLQNQSLESITNNLDSLDMIDFVTNLESKLNIFIKSEYFNFLRGINLESLIQKLKLF